MSDDVRAPLDVALVGTASASPPSELRTFLVADIRGYTSFTQRFGDERAGALAQRFARAGDRERDPSWHRARRRSR
jgi:class 3 adenylate cyclase